MKKPSKIKVITAKVSKLICPIGYAAITWFGTIFTRKEEYANLINKTDQIDSTLKCHETIHVRQAQNTNDSWFRFYCLYVWQWICNLPLVTVNLNAPYKFIPFEMEAYKHEREFEYPNLTDNGCAQWRVFKKMTLKEKRNLAKEYYNKWHLSFCQFLNEYL